MDKELKQILLKAKKAVFSNLTGENLSRLKGDGIDLRDIKPYEWGDDIRRINWKATAKTGNILVNSYDEYKQLDISLIYLASATLNFGSKRLKQDVASEVLAYLLFSSYKNKDRCETLFFAEDILKSYPPVKNINQVDEIVESAFELDTFYKTINYDNLIQEINKRYKKGRIIVFVGDFLTLPDFSKLNPKHQTYAVVIRDRLEESLEFDGEMSFKDPTTFKSEEFFINHDIKNRYKKLLIDHDKALKEEFLKKEIDFQKIKTEDDVYLRLTELFK